MNLRILTSSAVLGGVLLLAAAQPAVLDTERSPSLQQDDQDDETQLGRYMEQVNEHLKALKTGLEAESPVPPARIVEMTNIARELQILFTKARQEDPQRVAEVAEAERAAWLKSYRMVMVDLSRKAIDLEVALMNEDLAAAEELRKEINGFKRNGHRTYK